ncbi:hypothetical protein AALO_G00170190 [Alosa alosa]|uniref:Ig-like domain-containing protein n=1 Tax=Alosa alosa TaxID=278164 RepID=A0AAV6GGX4_9TELE|nr:uncharacterized protein cd8b [Alosa alosa]KAG5272870.1 hypothetical protein AALO_G00170190 [Alosa alosa]
MSLTTAWVTLTLSTVVLAAVKELYIRPNDSVPLACECSDKTIQKIFWYRTRQSDDVYEYISFHNAADHSNITINKKLLGRLVSQKSGQTYTLTVKGLQVEDAGWYSCFFLSKTQTEFNSYWLRVGEVAPTPSQPPKPKTTTKKSKSCCSSKRPPEGIQGCGKWVLWPLSGCLVVLAVFLVAVLCYFNRLPKKCRHQFVKGQQLR